MAGATESEVRDIEDLLTPISKRIFPCGGRSYGLVAKLCNNLILAASMISVSEALLVAKRAGLDDKLFAQLVNSSSGRCWVTEKEHPSPRSDSKMHQPTLTTMQASPPGSFPRI